MAGLGFGSVGFVGTLGFLSSVSASLLQPTPGTSWQHYTQGGGAATYFVEDPVTIRIQIDNPGNGNNAIQFPNLEGILVNGKNYILKIRGKAAIACNVGVNNFLAVSPYTGFTPPFNISLTTVYQDFSLPFTPTGMTNTSNDAISSFQLGSSPGNTFWLQVQVVAA